MHVQEISTDAKPYLASALKHFGAEGETIGQPQVVKARIEGDEFVMLWDRGIGGIAKNSVPIDGLTKARRAAKK